MPTIAGTCDECGGNLEMEAHCPNCDDKNGQSPGSPAMESYAAAAEKLEEWADEAWDDAREAAQNGERERASRKEQQSRILATYADKLRDAA